MAGANLLLAAAVLSCVVLSESRLLRVSSGGSQPQAVIKRVLDSSVLTYDAGTPGYATIYSDSSFSVSDDNHGSARVRTTSQYPPGTTFTANIKIPSGSTSGIVSTFYLSSLEGSNDQDEIDFEFLGKDNTKVQTNYFVSGVGGHEYVVDLGFDASQGYHKYSIVYSSESIQWLVDDQVVRTVTPNGGPYPTHSVYLYSSVWDASAINNGNWAGVNQNLDNEKYTISVNGLSIN